MPINLWINLEKKFYFGLNQSLEQNFNMKKNIFSQGNEYLKKKFQFFKF